MREIGALGMNVERYVPIMAWHWSHVAFVLPLAGAAYVYDGDTARAVADQALLKRTMRCTSAAFRVVERAGFPILPKGLRLMKYVPAWLSSRRTTKSSIGTISKVSRSTGRWPPFNKTKTCNRVIAAELARRSQEEISSVAFDPTFVIDKTDPTLRDRWPTGFTGLIWRLMATFRARHPSIAGEPIADLMLSGTDRQSINGALYVLGRRSDKHDQAMRDERLGRRLWTELADMTGLSATEAA